MLLLAAFLAFVLTVTYVYGHGTLAALASVTAQPCGRRPSPPVVCLVGLGGLTVVLGWVSLSAPISVGVFAGVVAGGLLVGAWQRREIVDGLGVYVRAGRSPGIWAVVGALALAIIVLQALYPPRNYDTGLYHAQAIRWIEEHAAVPGLANLHVRFGFNSAWFLPAALFSFAFLPVGPLHALNAAVQICFMLYALDGVKELISGSTAPSALLRSLLFAPALLYKADFSSDSPDLLAGLLVMVLFCLALDRAAEPPTRSDVLGVAIAWLSLLAVTTKLSVGPVALLVPYVLWTGPWREPRRLAGLAAVGAVVLAPWLARFVVMTGYLLFPLSRIDLFAFDWKVPHADVVDLEGWIYSWARIPRARPADVLGLAYQEWVPVWFANQLPINKLMIVGVIVGAVGCLVVTAVRVMTRHANPWSSGVAGYLHLVSLVSVVFWFASAPDFRFGFGFLWVAIALQALPLFSAALAHFGRGAVAAFLACLVVYEAMELGLRVNWPEVPDRLLVPAGYPPAEVVAVGWFGRELYLPQGTDQCWNAPRPCAPTLDPRLTPRGPRLEDGFRKSLSAAGPGGI